MFRRPRLCSSVSARSWQVAADTFGLLLKLMPLDENSPDPPDASEDLVQLRREQRRMLLQLLDPSTVEPLQLPVNLSVELRHYQADGISWLAFLAAHNLHGLLCDDMGLGKTLQTIAALASDTEFRRRRFAADGQEADRPLPSLVVCPTTLVPHWSSEMRKFCKAGLRPLVYAGLGAEERVRVRRGLEGTDDVLILSYETLRNHVDQLAAEGCCWNYAVLDEGHIIKNPKSQVAQAVKRVGLCANHRLILTGTPIQNNVLELWGLFDFLMPGFLGHERQFNQAYSRPILASGRDLKVDPTRLRRPAAAAAAMDLSAEDAKVVEAGEAALQRLHRQVLPFMLRRTKQQVLQDLPPKIIQDILCPLSPLQRQLYDAVANRLPSSALATAAAEAGEGGARGGALATLLEMRRVANHPLLALAPDDPRRSDVQGLEDAPKLLALRQLLWDAGIGLPDVPPAPGGHRVLVFAQQRGMLDLVEQALLRAQMPAVAYLRMDGTTPPHRRFEMQERFNRDESMEVMLLTTHVGGLGLTLTGADTVIFVEHDWNPSRDLQAMDRAHRIGQKKVVNVYRLIAQDTLEEDIMGLQRFKLGVAAAVVREDAEGLRSAERSGLLDLFAAPLVQTGQQDGAAAAADTAAEGAGGTKGKGLGRVGPAAQQALWGEEEYGELSLDRFAARFLAPPS